MKATVLSIYCCFGFLWSLAAGASIPRYFEKYPNTRHNITSTQIQRELGGRVSNATLIFGPNDIRFTEVTSRWNEFAPPTPQVVIEPGTESDVAKIVEYCNANSIEFLAISGGHGMTTSLGTFSGIQISMRQLDEIDIQPSGKSAWFGGGASVGAVTHYLWDQGFVATTGACECVGMVGAALGGGHGRQEGLYGLIIDNILQLNVVLANGTAIRVSSTSSYTDLLWAMKGAGHNFGIVTSFEMNIYPRGPDTWHYHNYIWRGSQLETVFAALNQFHGNGTTPINMANENGVFLMNATISDSEPILSWTFSYRGTADEAERHLAPFNAIESVYEESGDVPYPQVAHAQGTGASDPICAHGSARISSTAGLQTYNLTTERLIYEGFRQRAASDPVLAAAASMLHEGYATQGVDAVDPASAAYPFRADRHLAFFSVVMPSEDTATATATYGATDSLTNRAKAWAAETRDQWHAGQPGRPVDAYVNYAGGDETLEQMYGHESWRLERLRGLKARYDPDNRFRYYNPIIVEPGTHNATTRR